MLVAVVFIVMVAVDPHSHTHTQRDAYTQADHKLVY